jgi:hypothetical protein
MQNGSRGLGDDIKKITSATGLDQIAKIVVVMIDKNGSMRKQKTGQCIKIETRINNGNIK